MFNLTKNNALLVLAIILLILLFIRNSNEGMVGDLKLSCDAPLFGYSSNNVQFVPALHLSTMGEDYSNTGLVYNHDNPYNQYFYDTQLKNIIGSPKNVAGYYLANNCRFSQEGVDYDQASKMIINSKLNDLVTQHNYNIITSPHTHLGKNRGYINWE